jgi:signal transduction histidine kinase
MLLIIAGVLLVNVLLSIVVYTQLVPKIYQMRLQDKLERAYEIAAANPDGNLRAMAKIERMEVRILIVEGGSGEIVYTNTMDGRRMRHQAQRLMHAIDTHIAKTNETAYYGTDPAYNSGEWEGEEGLGAVAFYAGLADGYYIEASADVESLNETVSIAVNLAVAVGFLLMSMALGLVYLLDRATSRPIVQMQRVSKQMANLDFSERCDMSFNSDLNALAESINKMSDALETSILDLREQLHERERSVTATKELMANVSHNLKTPLALLSGYAEGLADGTAKTKAQREEYSKVIIDEAEHMRLMINKFLELCRAESGHVPLHYTNFNLSELLDALLLRFHLQLQQRGCVPERDYAPHIAVFSDVSVLEQTLTNLIENAISHMDGGNRLALHVTQGEEIEVRICNSSPPLSEDTLARIWDRFFRASGKRSAEGGNVGIGLAIVRSNLERLNYAFGVENVPGGIAFRLCIPKENNHSKETLS